MNPTAITALLVLSVFGIVSAQPNPLDTNVFGLFVPQLRPFIMTEPNPQQLRFLAELMSCTWESWSRYTPTTKGFFVGDNFRRPVAEHTLRNKNTAIAYAVHKFLYNFLPNQKSTWDSIIIGGLGLPVNNGSTDPSTPMGIANLCTPPVLSFFDNDNWNSKGDRNGHTYNRVPYADYTGYEPVNSPYDKKPEDPDRWVPLIQTQPTFFQRVQTFVTPQAGLGKTFAVDVRSNEFKVDRLRNTYKHNRSGYIAQAEQLITESANLDDRKKMMTEFFDNKFTSFGTLTRFVAGQALDRFVIIETLVNLGLMDAISLMWYHKPTYDGIRPISAIRFLKEGKQINAYGGPFQGTVTMDGKDWAPYLSTDLHPEYPSGTTCLCSVFAEVIRKFDNTDIINFSNTAVQGTSVYEPGFTPQQNVTFGWNTLTELVTECGHTRMWGGVHFQQSIDESRRVCTPAGTAVYNKFMLYLNGSPNATPRQ